MINENVGDFLARGAKTVWIMMLHMGILAAAGEGPRAWSEAREFVYRTGASNGQPGVKLFGRRGRSKRPARSRRAEHQRQAAKRRQA
jgi:hypothetical protein